MSSVANTGTLTCSAADHPELAPEWRVIWDFRRGGGKQLETFRLYRRIPG